MTDRPTIWYLNFGCNSVENELHISTIHQRCSTRTKLQTSRETGGSSQRSLAITPANLQHPAAQKALTD